MKKTFVVYSVLRELPSNASDKYVYMQSLEDYEKELQGKANNVIVTELSRFEVEEGYKILLDQNYN